MKKSFSVLIIFLLTVTFVFSGCGKEEQSSSGASSGVSSQVAAEYKDPIKGVQAVASKDKIRNYYEVFVYSFCDSNGDGIGDFKGLTSKLDYINDGDPNSGNDLGVDALWLMPIMPSPSYHKYNCTDYYGIHPEYGTMEDFEEFMEEAHKRGVEVIIDLVLNHASSQHPWFIKACQEISNDNNWDGYARYFNFKKSDTKPPHWWLVTGTDDVYYEGNFHGGMPEWNLAADCVRDEFKKIMKFWIDKGVDGFRLDAVKYFTQEDCTSTEFLKWLYPAAKEYKEDIYMVGEHWVNGADVIENYESGIDSMFNFSYSDSGGKFASAVNMSSGAKLCKTLKEYQARIRENNPDAIDALFISNHDQVRSATYFGQILEKEKMAAALYMLFPGNSYIYYGEELGMTSIETDESKRTPMIWSTTDKTGITELPPTIVNDNIPKGGGVAEQLEDGNSLLNYYRRIITIKNQNPEIARGKIIKTIDFDDSEVGAFITENDGKQVMIVHNLSGESTKTLTLTEEMLKNPSICADLVASGKPQSDKDAEHITLTDGKLVMPPYSTVVLKAK